MSIDKSEEQHQQNVNHNYSESFVITVMRCCSAQLAERPQLELNWGCDTNKASNRFGAGKSFWEGNGTTFSHYRLLVR